MSAKVVSLDGNGHQAVQTLLPWYVSGRLDRAEITDVEAHLAGCAQCQDELAWERKMFAAQAATSGSSVVDDAERGLALLRARIQAVEHPKQPPLPGRPTPHPSRWSGLAPWLPLTLGLQFAAIALLTVVLVVPQKPSEPSYRALGMPAQSTLGNVVVQFRPDATERDIRSALQEAGARVVDGPTATDAYLLKVPPEHQALTLAGLRAKPIVVLAESLEAGPRP